MSLCPHTAYAIRGHQLQTERLPELRQPLVGGLDWWGIEPLFVNGEWEAPLTS